MLKTGGYLILETHGAQGENWRTLPDRGFVASQLAPCFDFVSCMEMSVRRAPERITLKAVCLKRHRVPDDVQSG